jgi:hypothetical protein
MLMLITNPLAVRITQNVAVSTGACQTFLTFGDAPSVTQLQFTDNVMQRCSYGLIASNKSSGSVSWAVAAQSVWSNIAIIGTKSGVPYPTGTSWHPTVSSALSTGAGIPKALVDRAVAGVVVAP